MGTSRRRSRARTNFKAARIVTMCSHVPSELSSIETLEGGGQLDEDVLQHVVRIGRRVGKAVRDGEHRARMLFVQRVKSIAVSGGGPLDESPLPTCLDHSINSLSRLCSSISTVSKRLCDGTSTDASAPRTHDAHVAVTILDATRGRNLTCTCRTAWDTRTRVPSAGSA